MKDNSRKVTILLVALSFLAMIAMLFFGHQRPVQNVAQKKLKLYWFIPDGLRAEPVTFKVFEWAKSGKLPHLKKLMEEGAYGYSKPVFPGHTPTNFATLLTGTTPDVHGIADGPMRIEGYPLKMVSKGGFSSQAKKVAPLWYTLEQEKFLVTLLSIPGSTPPELSEGITVRGRWGGWGIDFPAINFHAANDEVMKVEAGQNKRVFNFGSELTRFVQAKNPVDWDVRLQSFSPLREVNLENWDQPFYALLADSTDDKVENYDRVVFSKDKKEVLFVLKEGDWSPWVNVTLKWELKNDYNIHTPKKAEWERKASTVDVQTQMKIRVIKVGNKDYFRIRFFYNNLNEYLIKPSHLFAGVQKEVGPMVDFVDNYPPQLIYLPEDKNTFIEEADLSLEWHKKMVSHMVKKWGSQVVIQSIYTPNQMLTSRWWMPFIDPKSPRYNEITETERAVLWNDVLKMYQQIDAILGEAMKAADENTIIMFSSDHGAIPLYKEVRLNNLFAKKGWLTFKYNKESAEYEIDWDKSKAIFLQMDNVYLHSKGLGGNYTRDSGPNYEAFRNEVKEAILSLRDQDGVSPVSKIITREESLQLHLPADRSGDLILANTSHYNWVEDVSQDLAIFKSSLKGGYKQAVLPENEMGMWTPFVIRAPGVKKNMEMKIPINHIDQYATLLKLLKITPPEHQRGKVLQEILD